MIELLEAHKDMYPEHAFPEDGKTRDAIAASAIRWKLRTLIREVVEMNPIEEAGAQVAGDALSEAQTVVQADVKNPTLVVAFDLADSTLEDILAKLEQHFAGSYAVQSPPPTTTTGTTPP